MTGAVQATAAPAPILLSILRREMRFCSKLSEMSIALPLSQAAILMVTLNTC